MNNKNKNLPFRTGVNLEPFENLAPNSFLNIINEDAKFFMVRCINSLTSPIIKIPKNKVLLK